MLVTAYTRRLNATTGDLQPQPAFVESIELAISFAAEDAVEYINFDALRVIVDSPQASKLTIKYSDDSECSNEYMAWKKILRSVLDRQQLTWALEPCKLQFKGPEEGKIIGSADILSVPTEYILGDVVIALSTAQQAEWLLCFTPDAKAEYLQTLVAARIAEESSSHADISTCPQSCSTSQAALT